MTTSLRQAIDQVTANQLCTGCGACARLADGVDMELRDGYLRPSLSALATAEDTDPQLVAEFRRQCPGLVVRSAPRGSSMLDDIVVGRHRRVWQGHSSDEEIRHAGSSGGVLTGLAAWLLTSGRARRVFTVAESDTPRRATVPLQLTTRDEALAAAGSRYCPASTLAGVPREGLCRDDVVIAKPCEVGALRAQYPADDATSPLLLSFFCAGTPSQSATDDLLSAGGIGPDEPLTSLRYRGNGWPGAFVGVSESGKRVQVSYDESWGKALGPSMQWRCKLCADGVGESADLVCADFWDADERGYPRFDEGEGRSAIVARTERGEQLIAKALRAGAITAEPLEASALAAVQPGQRGKRTQMFSRLLGTLLAGRRIPRYHGFGLLRRERPTPKALYQRTRATWGRAKRLPRR